MSTRTQEFIMDKTGIVKCVVKKNVHMDLDDAKENVAVVRTLSDDKRVPVLIDISQSLGITKEARDYFSSDEVAEAQSASALVVKNLFARLVGSFFLGLNKTKFPIQLFTNEAEAEEWLKTFL